MANDSVVVVQQAPGGDRPIDNSVVDNSASPCVPPVAHRQRTEPYGARLDRTQHRSETTLPASGNYSSQGAYTIPFGITRITYVVKYIRGGTGGYPRFRPKWGNGTEEADEITLRSAMTVAGHRARQKFYVQELEGPVPPNGSALTYSLPFEVPAGMTECRLLVAEAGNTGSPGTCGIAIVGGTPG